MDQLQSQHPHTFALKPVLSSQHTASGEYLFIRSFSDHLPNIYYVRGTELERWLLFTGFIVSFPDSQAELLPPSTAECVSI